jgi:hypothetical protein
MKDPNKVLTMCKRMLDSAIPRMHNQAVLNLLFNGGPPWTAAEAEADHHHTNVNFLEGTQKLHEARSQATNALKSPDQYFTVKIEDGNPHQRRQWGNTITYEINRMMKLSSDYSNVIDSIVANMILTGTGVCGWADRDAWCPTPRRYEDVMIPDETYTNLSNLTHFAFRTRLTICDLAEVISGTHVDPGWDKEQVKLAIKNLKERGEGTDQTNYFDDPGKLVEDWKQNSIYYLSDAVPVLHCFDFYYYEPSKKPGEDGKWCRRMIVDSSTNSFPNFKVDSFLYSNDKLSYGDEKLPTQIMHSQIADGAAVAPFRWHSVRSLGYLLYSICQLQNRFRSRVMDSAWESTNWYFRDVTDGDREVIQKVDLRHLGVIPNGLKWVLPTERHQIDFDLVSGVMAMNRQLMSEHGTSYTQGLDNGSKKERTAYEVATLSHDANRLITAMLTRIYENQIPQYREIGRRFCKTSHPDCVEFRKRCKAKGVPDEVLDVKLWTITPEKVLGGGNKMIQMAQAGQLMAQYDKLSPRGQQVALHIFVETITSDAALAQELAPLDMEEPSTSTEKASLAWGTLIDAKPVVITGDVNRIEFVEELLQLLAIEFTQIDQSGKPPDMKRLGGIANVIQTLGQVIQTLMGDESNGPRVKMYAEAIGNAQNKLKEYAKMIVAESQQNGSQVDPAIMGEIQAKQIKAESDAQINEAKAMQKIRHTDMKFEQRQRQDAAKTAADIQATAARTQVQVAGDVARQQVQAEAVETTSE